MSCVSGGRLAFGGIFFFLQEKIQGKQVLGYKLMVVGAGCIEESVVTIQQFVQTTSAFLWSAY